MPLATLADLEAIRGPQRIRDLLNSAVDKTASTPERDAQRQARLDAALNRGDQLIRQYLDLDAILLNPIATEALKPIAVDEALDYLVIHTETGSDEGMDARAQMRRTDLAMMRKREQFPALAIGQQTVFSGVVAVDGPITRNRLRGFY